MDLAQLSEALRQISDVEFNKGSNSPWYKFPAELVRDELVRRLKVRSDISLESKKVKFQEIIDLYHRVKNSASIRKSNDDFLNAFMELDASAFNPSQLTLDERKARLDYIMEHSLQLHNIHSQREDPFEGKTKPGDWRPDGTESCPVCQGDGKGTDSRLCSKCSGRGFITR